MYRFFDGAVNTLLPGLLEFSSLVQGRSCKEHRVFHMFSHHFFISTFSNCAHVVPKRTHFFKESRNIIPHLPRRCKRKIPKVDIFQVDFTWKPLVRLVNGALYYYTFVSGLSGSDRSLYITVTGAVCFLIKQTQEPHPGLRCSKHLCHCDVKLSDATHAVQKLSTKHSVLCTHWTP